MIEAILKKFGYVKIRSVYPNSIDKLSEYKSGWYGIERAYNIIQKYAYGKKALKDEFVKRDLYRIVEILKQVN